MRHAVILALLLTACDVAQPASDDPGPDAGIAEPDAADEPPAACREVDDATKVAIAMAATTDEYALELPAASSSATSWGSAGNEALVLEVSTQRRGLIGHLVLHQGKTTFSYGMHVGELVAGEQLEIKVSTLSAPNAVRKACLGTAVLTSATQLGAAGEGLAHAPELRWPVQKRFDDLPVVLGWSKARKAYQTVFTNENGGTTKQCGGGADGVQAEIARWSRAADIEGSFSYSGTSPSWERCTGRVTYADNQPRLEGQHPILYYGDGHNRVFESRAGYGQACGSGGPEKADGDLAGWNTGGSDTSLAGDAGKVIILRPLPVDLDALGYASFGGRREALQDHYAPWVYRLTALELDREGKIDNAKALPMGRYLYVDVRVSDVGGSGDSYCSLRVTGGFRLRAITAAGDTISGPQITADYASSGAHDWKRVAIPLPAGVGAADIARFQFDAYDGDGIYVTAIGDAFVMKPAGANGATLDTVRTGTKALQLYVDDDTSSCTNGVNTGGPNGLGYTCTGTAAAIAK